jgi:hypothetical protein
VGMWLRSYSNYLAISRPWIQNLLLPKIKKDKGKPNPETSNLVKLLKYQR